MAVAVTVPVAVAVAEKVAPGRWLAAQLVTSHLLPFDELRAAHVTFVHLSRYFYKKPTTRYSKEKAYFTLSEYFWILQSD